MSERKNLPADLPEQWQPSQTVTPGGIEAGLPEQYGYNYLMKAVNDAHRAINQLRVEVANKIDGNQHGAKNVFIAKDGSNTSGDGSKERPFQTIERGILLVKSCGNAHHRYTINIYEGTYNELLNLDSMPLTVVQPVETDKVIVESPTNAIHCSGSNRVDLNHITVRGLSLDRYIGVISCECSNLIVTGCVVENTDKNVLHGIFIYGGSAVIRNGTAINNTNTAIFAKDNASVVVSNSAGNSNLVSLDADAGTIYVKGSIPAGAKAEQTSNGGRIFR